MQQQTQTSDQLSTFFIQKIHEDSIIPTKGSIYAAGYDIYSYVDDIISPQ